MTGYEEADIIKHTLIAKHNIFPIDTQNSSTARTARKEEIEKSEKWLKERGIQACRQ